MSSITHFAVALVASSFLAVEQGIDKQAWQEDLLDLDFVERISPVLEKITWRFPDRDEVVLSYRLDSQLDLRVQFPLHPGDDCSVSVWFVPKDAPSVYEQLTTMREKSSDAPATDVIRMLQVVEDTRQIPCEGSVAQVLARAEDFSIKFVDRDMPPQHVYFDTPTHSVDLRLGDMRVTLNFPASLDHPLSAWASEVKRTVTAYIDRGFESP